MSQHRDAAQKKENELRASLARAEEEADERFDELAAARKQMEELAQVLDSITVDVAYAYDQLTRHRDVKRSTDALGRANEICAAWERSARK